MKIIYWSDYACPFCYIGEARMKKAMAAIPELAGAELEMKAFQLDPSAGQHAVSTTQPRLAEKYGISVEAAGERIAAIEQMAAADGLTLRFGTSRFTNTMDAHRLTKLAYAEGKADAVIDALFAAQFSDNAELADRALLQRVGEGCGLDAGAVRALLDSDQYRDEVLLDEREAARYGIRAVPFFIVGRYGISGAQSVETMQAALRKVLEEDRAPETAEGAACGPDGCRIE